MAKKWIKGAIKHPGALHRQLGVPEGEKIPAKKMASARSGAYGPLAEKRAHLAKTLKSFDEGGPVNKTGPAMLHEGEYVVPADDHEAQETEAIQKLASLHADEKHERYEVDRIPSPAVEGEMKSGTVKKVREKQLGSNCYLAN